MRNLARVLAAGAIVAPAVGHRDPPGVFRLEVQARHQPPPTLHRRAEGTVTEDIDNEKQRGGYFATCTIGTPPQDIVLLLDTGSSDAWVPATEAPICSERFSQNPCPLGSYDPGRSRTSEEFLSPGALEIEYLDQSYVNGDYFRDTFEIGESSITNFTVGVGLNTTITHGVIGIGYTINEATVRTEGVQYPNLPVALAEDGVTNTIAYSLWLNDLSSTTGNILFGGVDTDKYVGDMLTVRNIPVVDSEDRDVYEHFRVALTSIEAKSPSGSDQLTTEDFPIPVILDSGTTLSSLPQDIVDQMWQTVGAEFSNIVKQPLVPCYRRNSPGEFVFGFGGPGGPQVAVPMNELVMDLTLGEPPAFPEGSRYEGDGACLFGMTSFGGPPYILGATFLRSAYVVFDLVNNEVGIAQTDFNATDSSVVVFARNGSSIPEASAAPNQGEVDTPGGLGEPDYNASDGFQNSNAWALSPSLSTALAAGLAFWLAL